MELIFGCSRGELVPIEQPGSMQSWAEHLVARARADGVALTGEGALLTDLMRDVLRAGAANSACRYPGLCWKVSVVSVAIAR